MTLNSIDRCRPDPPIPFMGHSYAKPIMPHKILMICSTGIGLTAPSKFLVRKSQNTLGQKKPWRAAATWSAQESQSRSQFARRNNLQAAAVSMIRRARWFLMSLPIAEKMVVRELGYCMKAVGRVEVFYARRRL